MDREGDEGKKKKNRRRGGEEWGSRSSKNRKKPRGAEPDFDHATAKRRRRGGPSRKCEGELAAIIEGRPQRDSKSKESENAVCKKSAEGAMNGERKGATGKVTRKGIPPE